MAEIPISGGLQNNIRRRNSVFEESVEDHNLIDEVNSSPNYLHIAPKCTLKSYLSFISVFGFCRVGENCEIITSPIHECFFQLFFISATLFNIFELKRIFHEYEHGYFTYAKVAHSMVKVLICFVYKNSCLGFPKMLQKVETLQRRLQTKTRTSQKGNAFVNDLIYYVPFLSFICAMCAVFSEGSSNSGEDEFLNTKAKSFINNWGSWQKAENVTISSHGIKNYHERIALVQIVFELIAWIHYFFIKDVVLFTATKMKIISCVFTDYLDTIQEINSQSVNEIRANYSLLWQISKEIQKGLGKFLFLTHLDNFLVLIDLFLTFHYARDKVDVLLFIGKLILIGKIVFCYIQCAQANSMGKRFQDKLNWSILTNAEGNEKLQLKLFLTAQAVERFPFGLNPSFA